VDMRPPRVELALLPTPLVRASRLERALEAGPIFVKRDDLTGFGTAGNKARALEFLLGAALHEGADILVTAGSPSSNFCAAAAMAARLVGMDCDLLFAGEPPSVPSPNVELARASGARLKFGTVGARDRLDDAVLDHADVLRAEGRRPYAVPRGGATAVGSLGFVFAARELAEQCTLAEITPRTVVVATGSGGTQAGLVAGRVGFGLPWLLVGASVSRPAAGMADQILRLARECATAMGLDEPSADDVDVRDCRGAGFGIASAEDHVSSRLALEHEGLLLDDYYGAKAMTLLRGLLDADRQTPVIFWHTGGVAAAITGLMRAAA
jgi:1-aminocyclopropane-1-carboxylate deaminase/D-cysteine desulfhydrase-like pyridoxal-dependent ACC family enzyme